jgi:hypothetical protein
VKEISATSIANSSALFHRRCAWHKPPPACPLDCAGWCLFGANGHHNPKFASPLLFVLSSVSLATSRLADVHEDCVNVEMKKVAIGALFGRTQGDDAGTPQENNTSHTSEHLTRPLKPKEQMNTTRESAYPTHIHDVFEKYERTRGTDDVKVVRKRLPAQSPKMVKEDHADVV